MIEGGNLPLAAVILHRAISCTWPQLSNDEPRKSAMEPNRHAGLEAARITLRIEPQAQRIAVVIADRALGLPGRERSERHELGDNRGRQLACTRACRVDPGADGEAVQRVFPGVEG